MPSGTVSIRRATHGKGTSGRKKCPYRHDKADLQTLQMPLGEWKTFSPQHS